MRKPSWNSIMKKILLLLASLTLANHSHAELSLSNAEVLGFDSQRLERIAPHMQGYIDSGKLAGTLTFIAKDGKVAYLKAQGMRDKENGIPMTEDTIFRIYSMTKPITAVAALTLWEQGKFNMQEPISKYLPEFANMHVYVSGEGENMVTKPASKQIKIKDLFMHIAGLSYGFNPTPLDALYREKLYSLRDADADTFIKALAGLPLAHEPGAKWTYGFSTDVVGRLVEVISGMSLGDYMQKHIFAPLDMQDTGFYVRKENHSRFSEVYTANEQGQTILTTEEPLGDYLTDPKVHSGGGGLTSTLEDYFKFAQMLLNKGELNGVRILSRKTVEYMSSDQLAPHQKPFDANVPGEGFGLAMSVTTDPALMDFLSSKGNYGWGGMASTYFRIDPQENLIMIAMTQFIPMGFHPYHDDFRNLVYQALD